MVIDKVRQLLFITLIILLSSSFSIAKIKTIINLDHTKQIESNIFNNEIASNLITKHITIGYSFDNESENTDLLPLIQKMEKLYVINIVNMLNLSTNQRSSLNIYIHNSQVLANQVMISLVLLQQKIQYLEANLNNCTKEKSISDQRYFEALNNYDTLSLQDEFDNSMEAGLCITRNKIEYNAKVAIQNKAKTYYNAITQKSTYLENNQDIILDNIDILNNTTIQQIDTVQKTLQYQQF